MGSRSPADRLLVGLIAWAVVLSSCTSAPTEPQEADDCNDLADVGVELVIGYLELVDQLDAAVILNDAPLPDDLANDLSELERKSAAFDVRASDLACDADELRTRIRDRTSGLESDEYVGRLLLQLVRG